MKKGSVSAAILALTALAAGLVDVWSFAKLGGIFASAMTGNLALLGFYAATGAAHSALKSLSALGGFIAGCAVGTIRGRGKSNRSAIRGILGLELWIIVACAVGNMRSGLAARGDFMEAQILLLGFAMGMQSVVGARLKQPNVVFTTTLMKIVTAAFGCAPEAADASETRRETAVVVAYLIGALIGGVCIAGRFAGALLIALVAVGVAFICARRVALEDA
jgi:uncharacterized membrane protein YoaK (UPF0700 family)